LQLLTIFKKATAVLAPAPTVRSRLAIMSAKAEHIAAFRITFGKERAA
jgi:hypothetical protein